MSSYCFISERVVVGVCDLTDLRLLTHRFDTCRLLTHRFDTTLMDSTVLQSFVRVETDTRPGGRMCKKPKDLSACEGEDV